jgi:20S proteasome subunit beta 2
MEGAGLPRGGFDFELVQRNSVLEANGVAKPRFLKTGTTITGVVFKGGVVLGADTRSTSGSTVADKNCEKIHYIAPNIYCCGAGTAADTEATTLLISGKLELHRLATGRQSRVVAAKTLLKNHLFRYQGHVSAALVLGGCDVTGPSLYTVYPHGSTDMLPYVTMGSGSLAAMAVFENGWKENMTREEAVSLVRDSIRAGIFNDLGSGSNVDICVITKDKTEYLRNYETPNPRTYTKPGAYNFPRGTTAVLKSAVRKLVVDTIVQPTTALVPPAPAPMET